MKKIAACLLFVVFCFGVISSQEISEKNNFIIQTEALKIIKSYEEAYNKIGKQAAINLDQAKSEGEALISLFINRQVTVCNDLDPAKLLSKFYEIETYTNNLILWYKGGITIEMKYADAKVTNIIKHNDEVYSIDVFVPKKIDGNYLNKTLNQNTEQLIFRIAFSLKNGDSPSNFKIAGIRDATSTQQTNSKSLNELNSEQMSKEDLAKINASIKAILGDYINYLTLLADKNETEADKKFYKERFLAIFSNDEVYVVNDNEAKPKETSVIVKNYLDYFSQTFSNGVGNLALNIDSAEYSKVSKTDKNMYYSYVYVDKFFTASADGKESFRADNKLTFKLVFEKNDKSYSNFKIASIVVNSSDYANIASSTINEVPKLSLQEVSRKGFSVGVSGGIGQHQFVSNDLLSQSLNNASISWNYNSNYFSYKAGASASYYFINKLGISFGVFYSTGASTYTLDGTFPDNNHLYKDLNDDYYYKTVTAENYDSVISFKSLNIPLHLQFHSSKPGKLGVFGALGVSFDIPFDAEYTSSGSIEMHGTLTNPVAPELTEIYSKQVGAWSRSDETSGSIELAHTNISLSMKLGIEFYLNYFLSIQLGAYYEYGFSDLDSNISEYRNIFGNMFDHNSSNIKNQGIFLGFTYKL